MGLKPDSNDSFGDFRHRVSIAEEWDGTATVHILIPNRYYDADPIPEERKHQDLVANLDLMTTVCSSCSICQAPIPPLSQSQPVGAQLSPQTPETCLWGRLIADILLVYTSARKAKNKEDLNHWCFVTNRLRPPATRCYTTKKDRPILHHRSCFCRVR